MDVPRNNKTLADMIWERIGPNSAMMTGEHTTYKSLKELGYDATIMLARTAPNWLISYLQHLEYERMQFKYNY